MQENEGDYRRYMVGGSPSSIGLQMASHHRGPDGPRLDELSGEQIAFARMCAEEVERVHSPLLVELTSWADGCGLPLDEALYYLSVGMTQTSRRGRSRRNPTQAEAAAGPDHVAPAETNQTDRTDPTQNRCCSTVGVMTKEGPVVGRNFDLYFGVKVRHLVSTDPEGFLPHTGMYDGLVAGRTEGMNAYGLFASLHTVRAKPPAVRRPGLFCVHLVRAVLELCRTAREAAECLQSAPHISPFTYFLADKEEMLVVEAHPERTRVRHATDGVLACTNHYVHPEMTDLLHAVPPNSAARLSFLTARALPLASRTDVNEAAAAIGALMGDHTVPVCWHTETMSTLWSAVASPATSMLRYALGAPCRTVYA